MKELLSRLCKLLEIKNIITLAVTYVFCKLSLDGIVGKELFSAVLLLVIKSFFDYHKDKNKSDTEQK